MPTTTNPDATNGHTVLKVFQSWDELREAA